MSGLFNYFVVQGGTVMVSVKGIIDWSKVLSGDAPIGHLIQTRKGEYDLVLKDEYQRLDLSGSFLVVRYELMDLQGERDTIWVLCGIRDLTAERDLPFKADYELRINTELPVGFHSQALRGKLIPFSFYSEQQNRLIEMRGLPLANTAVYLLRQRDLNRFIVHQEWHFRIGHLLGTNYTCGVILRHFGAGGWGDAVMTGVIGPTGSGKTFISCNLLAGYGRYSEMGLLILDYQGQLSRQDTRFPGRWGNLMRPGEKPWFLSDFFQHRSVRLIKADEIAFDRANLFIEFLVKKGYFKHFIISSGEKYTLIRTRFTEYLQNYMKRNKVVHLGELTWGDERVDWYQVTQEIIASCFKDRDGAFEGLEDVATGYNNLRQGMSHREKAQEIWERVHSRFKQVSLLSNLIDDVLLRGKVVVISFDRVEGYEEGAGSELDDYKLLYYAEIIDGLIRRSQCHFYSCRHSNALVFVDEAQALFGQAGRGCELQERIEESLIQAVRTTRKLGLGWLFNSTSFRGIPPAIYEQLNTKFLGAGLLQNPGDEGRVSELFGGNSHALAQYKAFPKPRSTGLFVWTVIGEMQPLGSGTTPLFIRLFQGQQDLRAANPTWFVDKFVDK